MAYDIQINEYQRELINKALKAAMASIGDELEKLPGDWNDTAKEELQALIEMTNQGELKTEGLNGLCL